MKAIVLILISTILVLAIGGLLSIDFLRSASWNCVATALNGYPCPEDGGLQFASFHLSAMQKAFATVFSLSMLLVLSSLIVIFITPLKSVPTLSLKSWEDRDLIFSLSIWPSLRWSSLIRSES